MDGLPPPLPGPWRSAAPGPALRRGPFSRLWGLTPYVTLGMCQPWMSSVYPRVRRGGSKHGQGPGRSAGGEAVCVLTGFPCLPVVF